MTDEFGAARAAAVSRDHVLADLGGRTVEQALEAGIDPRRGAGAPCATPTRCRRHAADRRARRRSADRRVADFFSNRCSDRFFHIARRAVHSRRRERGTVGAAPYGSYRGPRQSRTTQSRPAERTPARWQGMTAPDREKALELALAQIEKQYGKGSVMRLGDDTRPPIEVIPTGLHRPGRRARHRRPAPRPGRRDLRPGVQRQDHGRPARGGQRAGAPAASPPSSTPSTRSTRTTPRRSASTPTRCWSPSRTPASRRWRSPTC